MRIVSWNVNGIRAALRKGFVESVLDLDADVVCVQETKAHPEQVDLDLPGYEAVWNSAKRRGYSGTAVFSREPATDVSLGLGREDLDTEGRVVTARFGEIAIVTVYTPNSGRKLARLDFRTDEWDPAFRDHVAELAASGPVVVCGDLNVAREEIDLADPDGNHRTAGFTDEERERFEDLLAVGLADTFRIFRDDGGCYTYWPYWNNCRERNLGWRIDYVLVTEDLLPRVQAAGIHADVTGSDHCPVSLDLQ